MIQPEVVLSFLHFEDFGLMLVMVALLAGDAGLQTGAAPLDENPCSMIIFTTTPASGIAIRRRRCLVRRAGACAASVPVRQLRACTGNWDLLWALTGIPLGVLCKGRVAR